MSSIVQPLRLCSVQLKPLFGFRSNTESETQNRRHFVFHSAHTKWLVRKIKQLIKKIKNLIFLVKNFQKLFFHLFFSNFSLNFFPYNHGCWIFGKVRTSLPKNYNWRASSENISEVAARKTLFSVVIF